jgi:hypothetical protein
METGIAVDFLGKLKIIIRENDDSLPVGKAVSLVHDTFLC